MRSMVEERDLVTRGDVIQALQLLQQLLREVNVLAMVVMLMMVVTSMASSEMQGRLGLWPSTRSP